MYYQLTIAIKQRKCSACRKAIEKGAKHFIQSEAGLDWPIKKNICLNCVPKFLDTEFIGYLKTLLAQTENLKAMSEAIKQPGKKYICGFCFEPTVEYNPVLERYRCLTCEQSFENPVEKYCEEVKVDANQS